MVTLPISEFLDCNKEFHVHVDASCIALGVVLVEPSAGEIDHPIDLQLGNYLNQRRIIQL